MKYLLSFLIFCTFLNTTTAQNPRELFVETGLNFGEGSFSFQRSLNLAGYLEFGIKKGIHYNSLRYTTGITPIHISESFIIGSSQNLSVELNTDFIQGDTVIYSGTPESKFESFQLSYSRRKPHRSGYLGFSFGISKWRSFESIQGGSTFFRPLRLSSFYYKTKWAPSFGTNIGYYIGPFHFDINSIFAVDSPASFAGFGMGYRTFLNKEKKEKLENLYSVFQLSVGVGHLQGISVSQSSGQAFTQFELKGTTKKFITFGLATSFGASDYGMDREHVDRYLRNQIFQNAVNSLNFTTIYVGKAYNIDKKQDFYVAGGFDILNITDNRSLGQRPNQSTGICLRTGWNSRSWSGALAFHLPFAKGFPPMLEYKFGLGFIQYKKLKNSDINNENKLGYRE